MVKKTSWLKQDSIEGLIPHAKEMAEYILKKRFKLVLVGGVSAQTAAYMVKAVLKEKGVPIEAMPTFLTLGRANLKQRMPERTGGVYLTPKDIANFLRKKYPHQIKNTNQKLFILEESIESGYAMTKLKKAVKLLGFKKVKTGALTVNPDKKLFLRINFVGAYYRTLTCLWGRRRDALSERKLNKLRETRTRIRKAVKKP